jgi:hypothetical protein
MIDLKKTGTVIHFYNCEIIAECPCFTFDTGFSKPNIE